jgi:hypothetical protein
LPFRLAWLTGFDFDRWKGETLQLRKNKSNASICRLPLLIVAAFFVTCFVGCSSNGRPGSEPPVTSSEQGTVFGDELSLLGYSESTRDGHSEIELRWRALRRPAADYSVFIHAVGGPGPGGIIFQFDHGLKNSAGAPTSSWTAGESVSDRFFAVPPPGQSPGAYSLRVGVYVPRPFKVLPVIQAVLPRPKDDWKGQAILLEHVDCR